MPMGKVDHVGIEGVSISGSDAYRIGKSLLAYIGGKPPSALGPGFDRADDGTLRLTVDDETFHAFQLDVS